VQKIIKIAFLVCVFAAVAIAQCGPAPKSPTPNSLPDQTTPNKPQSTDKLKTAKAADDSTAFPEDVSRAAEKQPAQNNTLNTDKSKSAKAADDSTAFPEDISRAAEANAKAEKNAESGQFSDTPEPNLKRKTDTTTVPPVSPEESSSKATKLEPMDDEKSGNGGNNGSETGMNEMHKFDPHRADKDVEVGSYYMAEKNYKGAIMRFQDALLYKPGDVVATRKLGQAYEVTGRFEEARALYENYLKDFSKGPFAQQAQECLARLAKKLNP
jgi:tetratricopeptide (TPR) repeat protein